jgi:hypothetical protein
MTSTEASTLQVFKNCPVIIKPKVHYCVHKSQPLVPVLSQAHPVKVAETLYV